MPKAELNTKNEPKRAPLCGRLGSFLVFNSVYKKNENAAYPGHAALVQMEDEILAMSMQGDPTRKQIEDFKAMTQAYAENG